MKKITSLLAATLLLSACTKQYEQVTVSGDISCVEMSGVELFVNNWGSASEPIPLSDDGKSYTLTLPSKDAYVTSFFAVYSLPDGRRSQIFTPVYISPEQGELKIDIEERDGKCVFASTDKDNALLENYYQDFLGNHMRNMPHPGEGDMVKFVSRITEYADSLSACAKSEDMKGYFKLRAFFDRRSATSVLSHMMRGSEMQMPEEMTAGVPDVKDVVNNPAAKFFTQEVTQLVMHEIATGKRTTERIANLKAGVQDTALVARVENEIIGRFVSSYNFSEGVETGFAILDSVAAGHPNYENWKAQLNKRCSSVPGAPIPDVEIIDAEGKTHTLAEFKGKYVYIDFWASWCVPCNREIPHMKELEKKLNNDNVVFVGISTDEDETAWKEALARHGLSENQFRGNRELMEMLSIQSIPRYVIYDKDGKLVNANAPRPSSGDEILTILRNLK